MTKLLVQRLLLIAGILVELGLLHPKYENNAVVQEELRTGQICQIGYNCRSILLEVST